LNVDRTTVWRRLDVARRSGFVVNAIDTQGRPGREGHWRVTGQPTEGAVLPTVRELESAERNDTPPGRTPQSRRQQRNS
jgi:hypothetical protein